MDLEFGEMNRIESEAHSKQYSYNGGANWQRIYDEFQKADMSISALPSCAGLPALIIGSGPSLDDCLPFIKDFRGIIMASPSQLDVLEKWGIKPTYVVAVDSTDNVVDEQLGYDRDYGGLLLLTHPGISPRVLDAWKGRKRYFRLIHGDPFDEARFPWIDSAFPVMGSVNNMEVLIANYFGCSPILLTGVDYRYGEDGRERCQGWRRRGPYIFNEIPPRFMQTEPGRISSTPEMLFYATHLLGIWKSYRMNLVRVTDKGALTELPWIKPEDLARPITEAPVDWETTIPVIDASMHDMGVHLDDSQGAGRGLFHYRDQDLARVKQARFAAVVAQEAADFWLELDSKQT